MGVDKKTRILIVDDERAILFAMKEYCEVMGYEVHCAREMEEALALLSNYQYAVAVVDLRLTGVNRAEGLEIVGFARRRSPQTKIIVLTAYGSAEIIEEIERLSVDAFLQKPKPLPEVLQIVAGLIGTQDENQHPA